MKLQTSIYWMFFGSIIFGVFFNGMNMLAYRFNDLFFSTTLLYTALWMASGMVLIEILMFYFTMKPKSFPIGVFILFCLFCLVILILMRKQVGVSDKEWLRRMIPHHSTALTTSHAIYQKTENPKIKELAKNIIDTQEKEIKEMKEMLNE